MNSLKSIISGGQTGVERAALDVALKLKIQCSGWCQKGRLAEDGIISALYPLAETKSNKPEARTEQNVIDADATLILTKEHQLDKGSQYTIEMCKMHNKPVLVLNLEDQSEVLLETFTKWLSKFQPNTLNIGGPRESYIPGIYNSSKELLLSLISRQINGVWPKNSA